MAASILSAVSATSLGYVKIIGVNLMLLCHAHLIDMHGGAKESHRSAVSYLVTVVNYSR